MFEVIQAGWGNTLQDQGRAGQRQWGLGSSGPLDIWHFSYACLLAASQSSKRQSSNALEIRKGPVQLFATQSTLLSVCGYGYKVLIENQALPKAKPINQLNFRILIQAGESLKILPTSETGTVYLAVKNGFSSQRWQADEPSGETLLGSLSTDITANIGRPIKKDDKLHWNDSPEEIQDAGEQSRSQTNHNTVSSIDRAAGIGIRPLPLTPILRVIEGPEYALLPKDIQLYFWENPWSAKQAGSRMAIRLGPYQKVTTDFTWPDSLQKLPSHAVLPGTVQMPSPEQAIVLLAESQTTGGYPRIAVVIQADLWKLAHLPPNSPIYMEKCQPQEAIRLLEQKHLRLKQLASNLLFFEKIK